MAILGRRVPGRLGWQPRFSLKEPPTDYRRETPARSGSSPAPLPHYGNGTGNHT